MIMRKMDSCHRVNVLVTSCLKTPVNPDTKVPLALYERARAAPATDGEQVKLDSELDLSTGDVQAIDSSSLPVIDRWEIGNHIDLRELYLSNEEYYCKLEQLRSAHLHTMADMDLMYLKKLELKDDEPLSNLDRACLLQCHETNCTIKGKLEKAYSAQELRNSIYMDEVPNGHCDHVNQNIAKDLFSSPLKHIKNMWQGFRVNKMSPGKQQPSVSLENHQGKDQATVEHNTRVQRSTKGREQLKEEGWRPQVTVPKPFRMTQRETEYKRKGIRSRAEIERENEELRKELEELIECQRKFRATAVPAHVHLPLYAELQERDKERRRQFRAAEQQRLLATQRPFSFLEREQIKKQQKELKMLLSTKEQEKHRMRLFRAKPVPRAVEEAALGDRQREEQLYREIKKEMRATEMLLNATEPPSTLSKRLSERCRQREEQPADNRNRTSSQVPDFHTSRKHFQKQLASKREFRPLTACEPFKLYTSMINPCKEHLTADIRAEKRSRSAPQRLIISRSPRTPPSSVCSSHSVSRKYLPFKMTDAAKKRQEAVRKRIEQRKKDEHEEDKWKQQQKQEKRKLQQLIARRAQANDPHVALAQIQETKLKEFRKQDLQRRTEYREEMKEIQERVKNRPLLLERVTRMNGKRAAEKLYTDVLHSFGLSEAFINSTAPIHSKKQTADHHRDADFSDDLTGDYPADYEDYEHELEDLLADSKKDERGKLDKEVGLNEDEDSNCSYQEVLNFDNYIAKDADKNDKECGDSHHSLNSKTSSASNDGKRSASPLTDGGEKEEGKSRCGSQESIKIEGQEGGEKEENKNIKN